MAEALADAVRAGDRRALAQLISLVERGAPEARAALRALLPHTGRAHVVGIAGPAGSGKSTLIRSLVQVYRRQGRTVGVVAVDPTSSLSGGALLGDRVRLAELQADPEVFVRSMASRGRVGGLARATFEAAQILDAAGKDVVLVETVGVGQDEVEVASMVDSTAVLCVAGLGDDIQSLKAGLVEVADVLVVNKADVPGAESVVAELRALQSLAPAATQWDVPIVETDAIRGSGVEALVSALDRHRQHLASGDDGARRQASARARVEAIVEDRLHGYLRLLLDEPPWRDAVQSVAERRKDPYAVADALEAVLLNRGLKTPALGDEPVSES